MRDIKGGTGMAIDYTALGTCIGNHRVKANMSQEDLGAFSNVSNKHISNIELGKAKPSLEALVHIANALEVSTDDLLVDSLKCSASTADSELHRLLLDCNPVEEEILTRMVKELKAILYGLGI